jgi:GNAT superfamily N-acetyltransferase
VAERVTVSQDEPVIRAATPADRDALVRLLVAQLREHAIDTPEADVARTIDALLLRPRRARFLVAVMSGRPVGVAALSLAWPIEHGGRSAWLEELYVEPAARGRALGTALLRAACAVASEAGAVAVDLEVERSHERAAALYRREGFRPLERTHWVKPLQASRPTKASAPDTVAGGCFCGAIRYEVRGEPRVVSHCHCTMCRRAAGAPVVTWATYARDALRIVRGSPAELRSSAPVTRTFCSSCGTPLTFATTEEPGWIDVTVGSMDRPEAVPPGNHIWSDSALPWLVLDDDLPHHPRGHLDP